MDPALASQAFPDDPRMAEIGFAAAKGDAGEVARLAPGVNLDAQGDKRVTLLQWAILADNHAGFEALLDAGADPHAMGIDGESAVHTAAFATDPAFLESLIARGADLSIAAVDGGHGPLVTALRSGNDTHAVALLSAGADPDQKDGTGNTALHVVGRMGISQLALMLLEAGADPGIRNARGATFEAYLFDRPDDAITAEGRSYRKKIRERLDSIPPGLSGTAQLPE